MEELIGTFIFQPGVGPSRGLPCDCKTLSNLRGRFVRSSSGSRKKRVTILVLGIYSASAQCPALPSAGGPWSHLQRRGVLNLLMRRNDYLLIVFIAFFCCLCVAAENTGKGHRRRMREHS